MMRRKRLYEEMETEDMDSFDDTDYEFEEPQSTDTKDISSQIKTIVDRELKKIQTRDNSSTTQTESSQDEKDDSLTDIRDTSPETSHQKTTNKQPVQKKHTPIPSHSSNPIPHPSKHSKNPHKPRGHKGNKRINQTPKVQSKPHYNVVYQHLCPIIYPNNKSGLVRFNHQIKGNYIICSPIFGNDNPNIQMKKYLSLLRHCIKMGYRYFPIYTLDNYNQLIDISLVIFPHSQGEKDFTGLKRIIREFLSNYPIWSFMGCQDGLFSLYTNYKTIHYTYDRNDIEKFMVLYKKERDISLKRGSRHFINPSPQTKEEYEYRTKVGEICVGKKKV